MLRLRDGLIALALLSPNILHAQSNCADRAAVVASLETKYGEAFAGGAIKQHYFLLM